MSSGANFLAIICIWIIAVIVAVNYFMPDITTSIAGVKAYEAMSTDLELREEIGLDQDTSYVSLTPLGIFDFFSN